MYRQLTLWNTTVDIAAKLRKEKREKVVTFYHFNGVPLPMRTRSSRKIQLL